MKAVKDEWGVFFTTKNKDFMCGLCICRKADILDENKNIYILQEKCNFYRNGKPQSILNGGDCQEFDGKGIGKGSGRGVLEEPNFSQNIIEV